MARWGLISFIAAVLLVSLKPEYSPFHSYKWMVATFFLVTLLCRLIYNVVLYPNYLTPLKHLPTPPGRGWLRGNTDTIFLEPPMLLTEEWADTIPNNGLIRYYTVGNLERVVVVSPKALAEVLVQKVYEFPKSKLFRIGFLPVVGNGLLLAEGEEHRTQRKNLMPAFSYRHIKDLYPVFWSKGSEMVTRIENALQKSSPQSNIVQLSNWASRTTLDIIGIAGMGHDFNCLQDPDNEIFKNFGTILSERSILAKVAKLVGVFILSPQMGSKLPFPRIRDLKAASNTIRTTARQIIHEKMEKLKQNGNSDVDIVSVAIKSGGFSGEELIDQMLTFLAAGHETTAIALQWAVYALCKHPEMQTQLRDEVRTSLPSISIEKPAPVSAAMIDSLPYLNAFCNEVLRFYPPIPVTIREAAHDTILAGTLIPKDTPLLLASNVVNRSPKLWGSDARTFKPERWLGPGRANNGGANNNYAFSTFIHGPRSCIGQSFSRGELACLVALLVGRFQMELKHPDIKPRVRGSFAVVPGDELLVKLEVVDGW